MDETWTQLKIKEVSDKLIIARGIYLTHIETKHIITHRDKAHYNMSNGYIIRLNLNFKQSFSNG